MVLRSIGKACPYCGHPMIPGHGRAPTRDHVFPKARGYNFHDLNGKNRLIVCRNCNVSKKAFDIIEWHDRLVAGNDRRASRIAWIITELGLSKTAPPAPTFPVGPKNETRSTYESWEKAHQRAMAPQLGQKRRPRNDHADEERQRDQGCQITGLSEPVIITEP